ncbi:uncharacterized protein Z520_05994 [Fonsecaea multimorphosa CBS 102226]|uniref:Uncharacterized protein n=1 Tax=Fonsecaea multimorphosa CBS 102226 TaxID=1442371 RepID=A0A0D2KPN5_9EURO|nr:uncharacterized protein Z520_05994 [Fonsecaea multimorphosa CBS 102226]KIX98693.1 hypothetical protein Z520_05994 [Fonsecaea multimorphosa CBS 102226]OAL24877.1 hypothetical protein AYO22_05666 [Fonsecaea multimorphosa]
MSVLTVTGTNIPDPTLSYPYSNSLAPISSLPPHPAPSVADGAFTRPERKSYITTTTTPIAPARTISNHQHSRTVSSNTLPLSNSFGTSATLSSTTSHSRIPSASSHSRQSSTSNATMSMHRQGTTASATSLPRRSTSGRSTATNSPTSYVALMRKQKATVWCDRAQNIDPRLAAAQKAAKHRATLEVQGAGQGGRTSTISSGGVVGKIRHGGVPKAPGYVPANLTGASVPVRLSANEALGDEEEEGRSLTGDNSMVHARTGSGRSSTNSAKYRSGYPRPDQGRFSSTSTPPSEGSPGQGIPEDTETAEDPKDDYFIHSDKSTPGGRESEDSFGELKELSGPTAVQRALEQAKKNEDLRRRGSVDERTMSMGQPGVRLFVANPDIDD